MMLISSQGCVKLETVILMPSSDTYRSRKHILLESVLPKPDSVAVRDLYVTIVDGTALVRILNTKSLLKKFTDAYAQRARILAII